MRFWRAILFVLLSGAACAASASVERECLVAIQLRSGWTAEHKSRVIFVTGLELARMVTVVKIELRRNYVLILNGSSLPTVARLDTPLVGPGQEFSGNDFLKLFEGFGEQMATQIEGEGRDLKWRIRARNGENWVDPQMPPLNSGRSEGVVR